MGDLIDLTKKLPATPEVTMASNLSAEMAQLLNTYWQKQIKEELLVVILAHMLTQIIVKSPNRDLLLIKAINFIVSKFEEDIK